MALEHSLACFAVLTLIPTAAAQSGITARVSSRPNGTAGSLPSHDAALSATGRYVAFASRAQDLIAGGTTGGAFHNVFVHDRQTRVTTLESRGVVGTGGNQSSRSPRISSDGRYVVFQSAASDLIAGDTNGVEDVFRRDRVLGVTERVSLSQSGAQLVHASAFPQVSADGRYVSFVSEAHDVVLPDLTTAPFSTEVYVRDMQSRTNTRACLDSTGQQPATGGATYHAMSADARYVAFSHTAQLDPADTDSAQDVYLRDLLAATTTLIEAGVAHSGRLAISDDGRFVAFSTFGSGGTACHLHDRLAGTTTWLSDDFEVNPGALSQDGGRLVGRLGFPESLKLYERATGTWSNLANPSYYPQGIHGYAPVLSADGRYAAFESGVALAPGDNHNLNDVFAFEIAPPPPQSYCTAKVNSLGCLPSVASSGWPSLSSDLPFVVTAHSILNLKNGLAFYGSLAVAAPFQGGTLCVAQPKRTPLQASGGSTGGSDCTGVFSYDFNARIRSGVDPALVPGASVRCQYWSRDPAASFGTNTTDALAFVIGY